MNEIKSILLIEDNQVFNFLSIETIKDIWEPENIDVALNGEEAIRLIESKGRPDLIFLDINMPRMNGFEFLDYFDPLNNDKKTKVFMLTTSALTEDKIKSYSYSSVLGYFEKPLTPEVLEMILREYYQIYSTFSKKAS